MVMCLAELLHDHMRQYLVFCLFFAVLGFELRAYTLSHSTSLFL
jgi:hypothetical protein